MELRFAWKAPEAIGSICSCKFASQSGLIGLLGLGPSFDELGTRYVSTLKAR
jgi:hypothetical protein